MFKIKAFSPSNALKSELVTPLNYPQLHTKLERDALKKKDLEESFFLREAFFI